MLYSFVFLSVNNMYKSIKTIGLILLLFLSTSLTYSATVTETNDYTFVGYLYVIKNATGGTQVVNWETLTNYVTSPLFPAPTLDQVMTKGNFTSNTINQNVLFADPTWPDDTNGSVVIAYDGATTNIHDSVLIGFQAGKGLDNLNPATGSNSWHIIGIGAQTFQRATNVHHSIAVGRLAGEYAINCPYGINFGNDCGCFNIGCSNSILIGDYLGGFRDSPYCIMILPDSGNGSLAYDSGVTNCPYAIGIGRYAMSTAKNSPDMIAIGKNAASGVNGSGYTIAIGDGAGAANNAVSNIFIGVGTGGSSLTNVTYIGNSLGGATATRAQVAFGITNNLQILGNGQKTYIDGPTLCNGFIGGTSNMLWYLTPTNFLAFWCLGTTNYLGYMSNGTYRVNTNAFVMNNNVFTNAAASSTGSVTAITNTVLYFPANTQAMVSVPFITLSYNGDQPTNAVTPVVGSKTLTNFTWYSRDGFGSQSITNAIVDWTATTPGFTGR
jgi:hypothetical protein